MNEPVNETAPHSLVKLIRKFDCRSIVEVGVLRGVTTRAVLGAVGEQLEAYYLVDPWYYYDELYLKWSLPDQETCEAYYREVLERFRSEPKAHVMRMTSEEAACSFVEESMDLVYIDGNHHYKYVVGDIRTWWPKVKKGKILAGHDFHTIASVTKAVTDTLPAEGLRFLPDKMAEGWNGMTGEKWRKVVWWIQKGEEELLSEMPGARDD